MTVINGRGISDGIVFGKLYFYQRKPLSVRKAHIYNENAEIKRFESARQQAVAQLQNLYDKTLREADEASAMIFEIHRMMLEDADYCEAVANFVREEKINAEWAVEKTGEQFSQMFSSMDDSYMKERAADVRDISKKLIDIMSGNENDLILSDEPVILVTDELLPSETVQIDKSLLLGFAVTHGSANSHTAILARIMNIPAVLHENGELKTEYNGKTAAIDGTAGTVYIEPDEDTLLRLKAMQEENLRHTALLQALKGKESVTIDGRKVKLYSNAGGLPDIDSANQNDADGIGLFRSEFLYMEKNDFPSEEDQFTVYRSAAEKMNGKLVVIRTMDIGADKQAACFNIPKEDNPALGYRAIRICLDRTDIFKTQLRAIYRASAYGRLAMMFPMIISVDEIRKIKSIMSEVRAELTEREVPFCDEIETGIMIETPAAAIVSDELAREVDFFSIGTNDLTQYTLAVDRQNPKLDRFYDPHHKAILRLIKTVVDNAHRAGIWAGICGELAGDLTLTETFLAMGVDELSVFPSKVLELRKKVRETDAGAVKERILNEIEG